MKILFICSANKQRSKTAEDYFSKKIKHHQFLSAGTNMKICKTEGTTELTEDLLKWANKIYVMEDKHREYIKKKTGSTYYIKIEVLNIHDVYKYYDTEVINLLESKVQLLP